MNSFVVVIDFAKISSVMKNWFVTHFVKIVVDPNFFWNHFSCCLSMGKVVLWLDAYA